MPHAAIFLFLHLWIIFHTLFLFFIPLCMCDCACINKLDDLQSNLYSIESFNVE